MGALVGVHTSTAQSKEKHNRPQVGANPRKYEGAKCSSGMAGVNRPTAAKGEKAWGMAPRDPLEPAMLGDA